MGTVESAGCSGRGKVSATAAGSWAHGWYSRTGDGVGVGTKAAARTWKGSAPIVGMTRVAVGGAVAVGRAVGVQVGSGARAGPRGTRELTAVGVAVGGRGVAVAVGAAAAASQGAAARPVCGPCRSQYSVGAYGPSPLGFPPKVRKAISDSGQ